MKKRTSKSTDEKSVDRLMRNVASSLVRDFQNNLSDPQFCSEYLRAVSVGTTAEVRRLCPTSDSTMDVARFKATYQIESLMKRYRYQDDIYSDQELGEMAVKSFLDTQDRLATYTFDYLTTFSERVMNGAARYIARVLGKYDDEKHRALCRFGRRASVGIPARLASEAARWELPISGSPEQIDWFDAEMRHVECVQNYWAAQIDSDPKKGSIYQPTSSLTLTLVPKTFKSLRSIMPNTTIGSYQSFGLGEMIRKALKRKGYDIRTLQMRHRYLACQGSKRNNLVTADLSSASDSITVTLVKRLFPSDWFDALNQSRIGRVTLPNNQTVESLTFCTMGIGYTFPLQTLVFLSLLKSIEHVTYHRRARRTISVYGDDMIYPSSMHSNVVRAFSEFGFVINIDKTFHEGHFRESCGGDYYHGVDVRPFQPRSGPAYVGNRAYEAILYKFVNGLLTRWSEYEIGATLDYLLSELESTTGKAKIVPGDFPDDAGIKCPSLTHWEFLARGLVVKPKAIGHGLYRFPYLGLKSREREEVRHEPYLWQRLRGADPVVYHHDDGTVLQDYRTPVQDRVDLAVGVLEGESPLITREVKPTKTIRGFSGRRLRRTSTFVTVSHTGRYTRQSGVSGFETRR